MKYRFFDVRAGDVVDFAEFHSVVLLPPDVGTRNSIGEWVGSLLRLRKGCMHVHFSRWLQQLEGEPNVSS